MTGRILIVDAIPTNRIILRVKLAGAFYDVVQAEDAAAALRVLRKSAVDLVVLSDNLPDMSAAQACAALRRLPQGRRLPLIAVLPGDGTEPRRQCLLAGADDVLSRPLDDMMLLARVRSLLRTRDAEAELELRDDAGRAIGLAEAPLPFAPAARILLVPANDSPALMRSCAALAAGLGRTLTDSLTLSSFGEALRQREDAADVIVVVEAPRDGGEGLTLLPQLHANPGTRHAALHYLAHPEQRRAAAAALDMGASDVSTCGLDPAELALRLKRLAGRKQAADRQRATLRNGLRAAVIDPLTGLYNRRYALPHLDRIADRATRTGRDYAVLLADIDHFKAVNDTHGHGAGDAILTALAARLRDSLGPSDLLARFGGEEFLIALPDRNRASALEVAEGMVRRIRERPFALPGGGSLQVTISVGLALSGHPQRAPEPLVHSADLALYAAKDKGRNTVVLADTVTPLVPPDRGHDSATAKRPRRQQRKA